MGTDSFGAGILGFLTPGFELVDGLETFFVEGVGTVQLAFGNLELRLGSDQVVAIGFNLEFGLNEFVTGLVQLVQPAGLKGLELTIQGVYLGLVGLNFGGCCGCLVRGTLQEGGIKESLLDFRQVKKRIAFPYCIAFLHKPLLDTAPNDGLQSLWSLIRPQGCNKPVALDILSPRHKQEDEGQDSQAYNPMPDSVRRTCFFAVLIGFEVFFGIDLFDRLRR